MSKVNRQRFFFKLYAFVIFREDFYTTGDEAKEVIAKLLLGIWFVENVEYRLLFESDVTVAVGKFV